MANDSSKTCTITNNSGRDIVIASAVTADETAGSNAVVTANGALEVLKTNGGGTVIKNGSADAVTLDHSYTANGNAYVQHYNLQVCDSAWLSPIASLVADQQAANGSAGYAPQIIGAGSEAAMSQATAFYQTIAAYPDSKLATDYIALIQGTVDAVASKADGSPGSAKAVADAMDEHIAQFFQSTQEYKNVTLADVVAIHNYYTNFPCVWAQYKDSMTYYLYGSDGTNNLFAGILLLEKSGAVDVAKPAGGYTCRFIPAVAPASTHGNTDVDDSKAVVLTYVNGLFTDDPKADKPAIALCGGFARQSLFTAQPEDNGILCMVTGTVNGVLYLGFDTEQGQGAMQAGAAATDTPNADYWDRLVNPKDAAEWATTVFTFAFAVALIPTVAWAVCQVYRLVKSKDSYRLINGDEPAVKATEISKAYEEQLNNVQKNEITGRIKWAGSNQEIISSTDLRFVLLAGKIPRAKLYMQLKEALLKQQASLAELMKYKSAMTPEEYETISKYGLEVEREFGFLASRATLPTGVFKSYCDSFSYGQSCIEEVYSRYLNQFTAETKKLIDDNMSATSQDFGKIPDPDKTEEQVKEETNPEVEGKIEPYLE